MKRKWTVLVVFGLTVTTAAVAYVWSQSSGRTRTIPMARLVAQVNGPPVVPNGPSQSSERYTLAPTFHDPFVQTAPNSAPLQEAAPEIQQIPYVDANGQVSIRTIAKPGVNYANPNALQPINAIPSEQQILIQKIRSAESKEASASYVDQLLRLIRSELDERLQKRSDELQKLSEQLEEAKKLVELRRTKADEIVNRRFAELVGKNDALAWEQSDSAPALGSTATPNFGWNLPNSVFVPTPAAPASEPPTAKATAPSPDAMPLALPDVRRDVAPVAPVLPSIEQSADNSDTLLNAASRLSGSQSTLSANITDYLNQISALDDLAISVISEMPRYETEITTAYGKNQELAKANAMQRLGQLQLKVKTMATRIESVRKLMNIRLQAAQNELDLATEDLDRLEKLRAGGAVSQGEVRRAKSAQLARQLELDEAQLQLNSMNEQFSELQGRILSAVEEGSYLLKRAEAITNEKRALGKEQQNVLEGKPEANPDKP